VNEVNTDQVDEPKLILFDLALLIEPQGIICRFACLGHAAEWTLPKTVVRRANKAISIDHLFDILGAGPILGCCLRNAETNEPEFQMVPRAVNALTERVTKEIRLALKKAAAQHPEGVSDEEDS